MNVPRNTLRAEARFSGVGLHTGVPVDVRVSPGEQGIRFRYGATCTEASPENVTDTTRCTRLGEIATVEHLMSAFAGLEITDAEVEVSARELPGLDGSAAQLVQVLAEAGIQQIGEADLTPMFKRLFVRDDAAEVAVSRGSGHWSYVFDTGERWPHNMRADVQDVAAAYSTEIAPARTFALAEEIPALITANMGQGLDESSALVLGIEGFKNEPRFPNEPALHKLLDLIGDLYLSGIPIKALNVSAARSGHRMNVHVAGLLKQAASGT